MLINSLVQYLFTSRVLEEEKERREGEGVKGGVTSGFPLTWQPQAQTMLESKFLL